jgi:hypothetical protein
MDPSPPFGSELIFALQFEDRSGAEGSLGEGEGGEVKRLLLHLRAWLTKPTWLR